MFLALQTVAQTPDSFPVATLLLPRVEVLPTPAHLVRKGEPMSVSALNAVEISRINVTAQDLPYALRQLPGVVETSDGGNGVGYSSLRIRGTDLTRINVTLNGIPLNDAESHGVFFVNLPDFLSSTTSIQVQRGAGASTNGPGAFGASIHLQTGLSQTRPYLKTDQMLGSFGTRRHSVSAGTGLLSGGWFAEGRVSGIRSDGFIDRASSNLGAWMLSAGRLRASSALRFHLFSGKETTYQAWNGLPFQYFKTDSLWRYNAAGTEQKPQPYANQIDQYQQTQAHLIWQKEVFSHWQQQISGYYTRGKGYYEEFKAQQAIDVYVPLFIGLPFAPADLVRRRQLDNHLLGGIYTLRNETKRHQLTFSGAASRYDGFHYGQILQYPEFKAITGSDLPFRYYANSAVKYDANLYVKGLYKTTRNTALYWDLQQRWVDYSYFGPIANDISKQQRVNYAFFNPKLGASWQKEALEAYASAAVANREPNRDDFLNSGPQSRPKPETLLDIESGLSWQSTKSKIAATAYFMYYRNQLVATGQLNDVGAYARVNVPRSYRAGIELETEYKPSPQWKLLAQAALNRSEIAQYTEFIDDWDNYNTQIQVVHRNTRLAFAPQVVGVAECSWTSVGNVSTNKAHQWEAALTGKYVGQQFLDNTENNIAQLSAYTTFDLRCGYKWLPQQANTYLEALELVFTLQNLLAERYASNGWAYRYNATGFDPTITDPYSVASSTANRYQQIGLFPQAGRNFNLCLRLMLQNKKTN